VSLPWYQRVPADAPLDQGDLIPGCPVVSWKDEPIDYRSGGDLIGTLRGAIELAQVDVVVMTQTCDLQQQKVRSVILCPHYSIAEYRASWEEDQRSRHQNPTDRSWRSYLERIVAGQIWNMSVLNSEEGPDYTADLRIVDFHEVFSLPRDFLESWLTKEGQFRLRLFPPYREHLSQAFARFFMRVGLPTDIHRP
jgi:hypothetical protein